MEHTETLLLLRRHLANWSRSKQEKRTAGSAPETWTVPAVDSVCCALVGYEINFLITFGTTTFFCVCPVLHMFVRKDVGGWIMLKWALGRKDAVVWTGLIWLRVWTNGGLF
jgi:hypothetical protein